MKCPVCGAEMKLHVKNITYNEGEKEYDRELYVCEKDDVWINVEKPRKILA